MQKSTSVYVEGRGLNSEGFVRLLEESSSDDDDKKIDEFVILSHMNIIGKKELFVHP
jgi:hypothetical protein